MMESNDIELLTSADNGSYPILKRLKPAQSGIRRKRRKVEHIEVLENHHTKHIRPLDYVKGLLPIKTKQGVVIPRSVPKDNVTDSDNSGDSDHSLQIRDTVDSCKDVDNCNGYLNTVKPQTTAELLVCYKETYNSKKFYIGSLCSSLLENPEERISHFRILFKILEDGSTEATLSIKKLCIISLLEVFKDILPSYEIKHQDTGNVKLKKDTLRQQKYEETLLQYYKKYLQKLEKFSNILRRQQMSNFSAEQSKLGELAVQALSDLLVTHPYFNFSPNIAQAIIPFLNHREASIRQIVCQTCKTIFKEDKKEEITLKILRALNQYIRNRVDKIRADTLEVLLHLKIRQLNLDREKENEMKQKKIMGHKQNILKLSKKEKKRKKRLQEVEKEMLETKAEENKQVKQKNLTEITTILFRIYFKVLKNSTSTKALGMCLEGLAKFSHCINVDYYVDMLNLLSNLFNQNHLGYREQIHCIQIVFLLCDQGDSINIDPTQFYTCLYRNLFDINAFKTDENCIILIKVLQDVLLKRKRITSKRYISFLKRISTVSLQVLHNGTLAMLALIRQMLILNKSADILLDLDNSIGNGDYLAELSDPEYCNASSAALYELTLLKNYYHPIIAKYSKHIASNVPSIGEGSLPLQFSKSSPVDLFAEFNIAEMEFNPPVPQKPPKTASVKIKNRNTHFVDQNFKLYCNSILRQHKYSLLN